MKFGKATNLNRKSGGAWWRDLRLKSLKDAIFGAGSNGAMII
jgi:hypothetical protein